MIGTSKLTLCALPGDTVLLIRVIPTVIVLITFPAKRDAVVIFTSEFSRRITCPVLAALFITVVPAVIDTIAHSPPWDAAVVGFTAEFRMVVTVMCGCQAFRDWLI